MYDLTKVVLVGGECRLRQPRDAAGGRLGEAWVGEGYRAWLTPTRTPGVAPASFRGMPAHFSDSAQTEACYHMLSRPQPPPDPLLLQRLPRPSSLLDKTQLHSRCAARRVCRRPGAPCHVSCSQSPPPPPWPARSRPQAPFPVCVCLPPSQPGPLHRPAAPGSALTPSLCSAPGGWIHRGASCSRASRLGTRSGCASSTTASSTWIPRWAGSGRREAGLWDTGDLVSKVWAPRRLDTCGSLPSCPFVGPHPRWVAPPTWCWAPVDAKACSSRVVRERQLSVDRGRCWEACSGERRLGHLGSGKAFWRQRHWDRQEPGQVRGEALQADACVYSSLPACRPHGNKQAPCIRAQKPRFSVPTSLPSL